MTVLYEALSDEMWRDAFRAAHALIIAGVGRRLVTREPRRVFAVLHDGEQSVRVRVEDGRYHLDCTCEAAGAACAHAALVLLLELLPSTRGRLARRGFVLNEVHEALVPVLAHRTWADLDEIERRAVIGAVLMDALGCEPELATRDALQREKDALGVAWRQAGCPGSVSSLWGALRYLDGLLERTTAREVTG